MSEKLVTYSKKIKKQRKGGILESLGKNINMCLTKILSLKSKYTRKGNSRKHKESKQ